MGQISRKLRSLEGGKVSFWCPGCKEMHAVSVAAGGWTWNGDKERPTFAPSVLVTSGHHTAGGKGGCWCTYNAERAARGEPPSGFKCERCHSFVRDGRIEFLGDCTHALAGKTVPLPDLPDFLQD